MKCNEFQALIDAYLQETIEESLREEFEEHFFKCKKCFLGLKINETLQKKEVRIPLREKPRFLAIKVLRPILAMAALFLLILFSVLLVQHDRKADRLNDLNRFDLPLYHQGELRAFPGNGRALEKEFSRAIHLLQDRNFRAALDILEKPAFSTVNPKAEFFRAICYLGENEAEKAGAIFDSIIRAMDPAYFDEAIYYKGFVLLLQDKRKEALTQFEKLAHMISPMAGKARAMVQKINNL